MIILRQQRQQQYMGRFKKHRPVIIKLMATFKRPKVRERERGREVGERKPRRRRQGSFLPTLNNKHLRTNKPLLIHIHIFFYHKNLSTSNLYFKVLQD